MNEFFQCSVCFENYDTKIRIPRLLPCQHSFCSNCLPRLLTTSTSNGRYYDYYAYRNSKDYNSYIDCPICRQKHYTRLEDIPKSRLIMNLIEVTQGSQNNLNDYIMSQQTSNTTTKKSTTKPVDVELRPLEHTISPVQSPRVQHKSLPTQYIGTSTTTSRQQPTTTTTTTIRQVSVPTTYMTVQTQTFRHSPQSPQSPQPIRSNVQQYESTPRTFTNMTSSYHQSTSSLQPTTHYYRQYTSSPQQTQPHFIRLSSVPSNSVVNIHRIRANDSYTPPSSSSTTTTTTQPTTQYTTESQPRNSSSAPSTTSSTSSSRGVNRSQSLCYRSANDAINPRTRYMNTAAIKRNTNINNNNNINIAEWSLKDYLRLLFDEMDKNKDGNLCFDELQEALRRGQQNSEFNVKTVQLLFEKYDMNRDGEIDFDGFYDLYTYLNNEYCTFLTIDKDCSGTIDADELCEAFANRGYKFKNDFFKYIENTMRETNKNGITFDNYCRVAARFDYLNHLYATTPRYQANYTLESYLKKTFFFNFY